MQQIRAVSVTVNCTSITWPIPSAFPRSPAGNISAVTSHVTGPKDKAYAATSPQHAINDSVDHSCAKLRERSTRQAVKLTAPQKRNGFRPMSSTLYKCMYTKEEKNYEDTCRVRCFSFKHVHHHQNTSSIIFLVLASRLLPPACTTVSRWSLLRDDAPDARQNSRYT